MWGTRKVRAAPQVHKGDAPASIGEMKAARERESRLMQLLERQQQQLEHQVPASSGDEIAYEAGRKATLLELSEKLAERLL